MTPSAAGVHDMADLVQFSAVGVVQVIRLELPEALDSSEFDRLNDAVLGAIGQRASAGWVVDLSALQYAGSSVLGLLVNIRQRVKQSGGRLVICGLSGLLIQIFKTCSLERMFVIRKSLDEAVARAR
jgi:anti-sigma B factor antagonist